MIWFSFDSNILPLDEIVAFMRSRIGIIKSARLNFIFDSKEKRFFYQRKALLDCNNLVNTIVGLEGEVPEITFDSRFNYDLPGC